MRDGGGDEAAVAKVKRARLATRGKVVSLDAHRQRKKKIATRGKDVDKPPSASGYEWRKAGAGWVLWRRKPARSGNGKQSSKRAYVAYYSAEAVRRLNVRKEKTGA